MDRVSPLSPAPVRLVKLGGSVITDKSTPFSYRDDVVRALGREMSSSGLPIVLVHGGGSFGHPVAGRYGLTSRKSSLSSEGVSETRRAMFDLDEKVCSSLSSARVRPYVFSPVTLLLEEGRRNPSSASSFIGDLLRGGMTPVTFGDVVQDDDGFRIISGDTICAELATMLRAELCVMAMDVDGLLGKDGRVIRSLGWGEKRSDKGKEEDREREMVTTMRRKKTLTRDDEGEGGAARPGESTSLDDLLGVPGPGRPDATGGIRSKMSEAMKMASSGTEVRLVSGLNPAEFSKALKGVDFYGTSVRVSPGV
jgi:isopentenyl phosphate kinase